MTNVLFVTLDQFRGDTLGVAGHPLISTPTLDQIAAEGVRFSRHFSQAAPCSPGRAALYTGSYQMNNRVVANGTPHPLGFANVATVAREAGFDPTLFGYTDQGVNPSLAHGTDDPRLDNYDGVLPGFSIGCFLPESQAPWLRWLNELGYDVPTDYNDALRGEPDRAAEHSLAAFLTDRFIGWLDHQGPGWFAHLSHLRPHPPYAAAGRFSTEIDPSDVELPLAPVDAALRHPLHSFAMAIEASAAPTTESEIRHMRAQYYGMINEVDYQLSRAIAAIKARGEWDDTIVIVTSDHGEQLGDHGLKEKLGFFPQSYHVLGLWRDPTRAEQRGRVVNSFTENVDLLPTLCERLGVKTPVSCDGRSLHSVMAGETAGAREAAHYEWDWRFSLISDAERTWPRSRRLSFANLATRVTDDHAYVQFGDGSALSFDLAADPTWRTECTDAARTLEAAQAMLAWRQQHAAREWTDLLLTPQRPGRWPALV